MEGLSVLPTREQKSVLGASVRGEVMTFAISAGPTLGGSRSSICATKQTRWRGGRPRHSRIWMAEQESDSNDQQDSQAPKDLAGEEKGDEAKQEAEPNPLFDAISQLEPAELIDRFKKTTSKEVDSAFQATLRSLLGSMPSSAYGVQVRTIVGNLVSLMQTCTMTGYLMRNAQYRLSLARNIDPNYNSLPSVSSDVDFKGGRAIVTFRDVKFAEVDASEYVDDLRGEAQALREELRRLKTGGPAGANELYDLVASLDPEKLKTLTDEAGPQVTGAMRMLVESVLGTKSNEVNPMVPVETTQENLGELLLYSLVSGYFLREAQIRFYAHDKLMLGGEVRIPALVQNEPLEMAEEPSPEARTPEDDAGKESP